MYKVVICGCRNYNDYAALRAFADACLVHVREQEDICIVSGTCAGVDRLGERYAAERGYAVERHPADWVNYGRAAGPRRNREMVDCSDCVIALWDGHSPGTKSLLEYARRCGKPLRIKHV